MILETLNQLPEIALQNIMKIPTVESVGLPKGTICFSDMQCILK